MDAKPKAEFAAKDRTIDDLVHEAEALARELRIVVASMKLALAIRAGDRRNGNA